MKRFIACAIAMSFATPVWAAKPWHEAGTQGTSHFVVIDNASIKNQDAYRLAVGSLCRTNICQVYFWASESQAAKRLPMTDSQLASRLAIFQVNRNTNYSLMQWRCDIQPGPDCL